MENKTEDATSSVSGEVRPKRLGKPSYMSGVGVSRALDAITGKGGHDLPVDDLPMDDNGSKKAEQVADETPSGNSGKEAPFVSFPPNAPVSSGREDVKPVETKETKDPSGHRSKSRQATQVLTSKSAAKSEPDQGADTGTMYYTLRIGLSPEELLKLETYCFELRMKVIRQHKRKPLIGIQTLSQFFIRKLFKDSGFASKIEDELIEYLGAYKSDEP